jgi:hypothetical protein
MEGFEAVTLFTRLELDSCSMTRTNGTRLGKVTHIVLPMGESENLHSMPTLPRHLKNRNTTFPAAYLTASHPQYWHSSCHSLLSISPLNVPDDNGLDLHSTCPNLPPSRRRVDLPKQQGANDPPHCAPKQARCRCSSLDPRETKTAFTIVEDEKDH